jgi:hypothetical protein
MSTLAPAGDQFGLWAKRLTIFALAVFATLIAGRFIYVALQNLWPVGGVGVHDEATPVVDQSPRLINLTKRVEAVAGETDRVPAEFVLSNPHAQFT